MENLMMKTQAGFYFSMAAIIAAVAATAFSGADLAVKVTLCVATCAAVYLVDTIGIACGWEKRPRFQ